MKDSTGRGSGNVNVARPLRIQRLDALRILAAEDNALNRLVLGETLAGEGADVVSAEDGRHAIELVARLGADYFDLILMDVRMPEMDGLEATRRILALAPGVPVIGHTAHVDADEHAACRAAGMVDIVTKPVDLDALVAMVQRRARVRPAT